MRFDSIFELRAACEELPAGNAARKAEALARQAELTKPPGSLGRLEEIAGWLAHWQDRLLPRLDRVEILIFAGNHGVVRHGVSAFPAEVTEQMVANFRAGGAAINQLSKQANATLTVIPLDLESPTADFTCAPAMSEPEFLAAVSAGYDAVPAEADLISLGEMGIGNTTAAAAICAGLFGGGVERWVGRGTGVDDEGIKRKRAVIEEALHTHADILADPLRTAAALGGRELAAILGATLAARHHCIPVLVDGFICMAAVSPLARQAPDGLTHVLAAHVSAEAGHRHLLSELKLDPLLALGMRLGEGSGAAIAINILRAAVACHGGMATFAEAAVSKQ